MARVFRNRVTETDSRDHAENAPPPASHPAHAPAHDERGDKQQSLVDEQSDDERRLALRRLAREARIGVVHRDLNGGHRVDAEPHEIDEQVGAEQCANQHKQVCVGENDHLAREGGGDKFSEWDKQKRDRKSRYEMVQHASTIASRNPTNPRKEKRPASHPPKCPKTFKLFSPKIVAIRAVLANSGAKMRIKAADTTNG